ncbi:MAG TPA: hypothetical protein VML55_14155, partial [Planctomycetaceae bacterium]|nr:hypothetical protein [Planctomycetaceae bacterium]
MLVDRAEPVVLTDRHAHVIEHFNQTHAHYRRLWRLDHNLGMHIGFFDDRHRRHDDAVLNMNRVLAETAGITAADHVLDLGC